MTLLRRAKPKYGRRQYSMGFTHRWKLPAPSELKVYRFDIQNSYLRIKKPLPFFKLGSLQLDPTLLSVH